MILSQSYMEQTLVCDCPWQSCCEVDILAGLCFDATAPDANLASSRVLGRPTGQNLHRAVLLATTVSRASASVIPPPIPVLTQEAVVLAFRKLFPGPWFDQFRFPMIEDLVNNPVFRAYPEWLQERGAVWDGPLGPSMAPAAVRLAQRTSEGQQAGAYSQRASLPPLLSYGLEPDEHFVQARALSQQPLPTENLTVLDADLHFAAFVTARSRGHLRGLRQTAIKVLRELHRRWQGVTLHLRRFQSSAIQAVTHKRDIGLTGLLMVLISWPDATYPHGLIMGLLQSVTHHAIMFFQSYRLIAYPLKMFWVIGKPTIIGSWRAYARVPMMMWHWHSHQLTPTKVSALIP